MSRFIIGFGDRLMLIILVVRFFLLHRVGAFHNCRTIC
ncbi:Uncharacterised protein [Salmonella enterica subsp. enterica serovar Typhi]|nr:Uncharacterised protein [Salmonella enterica subsp. enterica serovar Typhi]VTP20228.1 Uncharacterised protein [Salmonella enterica subsp. enterica serovar Typhi str. Ty2]CAH0072792.1 Uncharacterised protein [Salmonella enterica subsp. enterica serovar Typhi]CAH0076938.1 Uncharacterised protein [Salmonella enterica subsp. enterica serovar Typhi]CEP51682.1 Uncharacterised protein [Salmonella enterica subsp. enterica serovar Typhi]